MSHSIMPFTHQQFGQVRVIKDEATGEPWFVAKDVAEALGYQNARNAIAAHCKHSKQVKMGSASKQGGTPFLTIIPKGDVYRLITRSKLPGAERFESWVFDEVLVSIDNHGGYLTPAKIEEALLNPDVLIQLATTLKTERAARQVAEANLVIANAHLEIAQPKAQLVDATFANRSLQGMKVYELARKHNNVNAMRIKADLLRLGYFYRKGQQYRVYYKYLGPDKLFMEKEDFTSHKHEIYATAKGAALITQLYHEGRLTMKAGYSIRR